MTAGWTGSDMAAGDVAWRAWRRLGVEPFALVFGGPVPEILERLTETIAPEIDRIARSVLDEVEVRLYGEARERVVAGAQRDMIEHVLWSVVGAVRGELMRPEPVPYTPPPAGAWIRARWAPRAGRDEPEWHGIWHLFSGDLRTLPRQLNNVYGRTRCGTLLWLRSDSADAAIANELPGVDVCRRCLRAA